MRLMKILAAMFKGELHIMTEQERFCVKAVAAEIGYRVGHADAVKELTGETVYENVMRIDNITIQRPLN